MLTTTPVATDPCICGHAGATHDATTQVCRFQKDPSAPCGCQSFGVPGGITNKSPLVGNTPPLNGPVQGVNAAPATAGNRNG